MTFFSLEKLMFALRRLPVKSLSIPKTISLQLNRSFFSERKIIKLEQEANLPENARNPQKQRALFKELFNSGNYKQCIYRFENPPQIPKNSPETIKMIQSDPVLL